MYSALLASAWSLFGLLFLGWSVWTAVAVYWVENVIRVPVLAYRIRLAFPRLSDEQREAYLRDRDSEKSNGVSEGSRLRRAVAELGPERAGGVAGRRFLGFYGVFAAVHGLFVFLLGAVWAPAFADGRDMVAGLAAFDFRGIVLAALSILVVELVLLWLDREPRLPDVRAYTRRTLVLHVTIVLGAFVASMFDARGVAVLFVLLKTLSDVGPSLIARQRAGRRGDAPA